MQPESYSIHRWVAHFHRNLDEYNDAEDHLELALEDNPISQKNNSEAGLLYLATENNEKHSNVFKKQIKFGLMRMNPMNLLRMLNG